MPEYLKLLLFFLMVLVSLCQLLVLWVWLHYGKQLNQSGPPLNNFAMAAGTLLMTAASFFNLREPPLHYAPLTIVFFISGLVFTIGGGWGAFQQVRRGDWRSALRTLTTRIK